MGDGVPCNRGAVNAFVQFLAVIIPCDSMDASQVNSAGGIVTDRAEIACGHELADLRADYELIEYVTQVTAVQSAGRGRDAEYASLRVMR
jgi:hypothetical protein